MFKVEANNIRYRLQTILPLLAFVRWITPVGRFPHAATPDGNPKFRCSVRKSVAACGNLRVPQPAEEYGV